MLTEQTQNTILLNDAFKESLSEKEFQEASNEKVLSYKFESGIVFYTDPFYAKYLTKHSPAEDRTLEEDIHANGLKYPIKINPDYVVLDGKWRLRICHKLGILPEFDIVKSVNPFSELLYVIKANTNHRLLTLYQKILLEEKITKIERLAEAQLIESGHISKEEKTKGRISELVAKKVGVSPKSVERVFTIQKEGTPDQIKQLSDPTKQVKIGTIEREIVIKNNLDKLKTEKLPDNILSNKFIMDFGWKYKNGVTGGSNSSSANQKYITKTIDDIIAEDVPIIKNWLAKDSVVFFWTTVPMFNDQLRVIDALGLKYKTKIYWIKENIENLKIDPNRGGWGYWYNGIVEECIVAVKGNVKAFHTPSNNIIFGKPDKRIHSKKPDAFVDLVKESTKNMIKGDIIDLFGRTKIDGVKAIGNQIIKNGKVIPIPGVAV